MSKFYVESGDLRVIVVRTSPEQAVRDAIRNIPNMKNPPGALSYITKAGERGFEHCVPDDCIFLTADLLESTGLDEVYQN